MLLFALATGISGKRWLASLKIDLNLFERFLVEAGDARFAPVVDPKIHPRLCAESSKTVRVWKMARQYPAIAGKASRCKKYKIGPWGPGTRLCKFVRWLFPESREYVEPKRGVRWWRGAYDGAREWEMQDLQIGCRSLTQPLFSIFLTQPTEATNGKERKSSLGPFWVLIQQASGKAAPPHQSIDFLCISFVLLGETQALRASFMIGQTERKKATEDQATFTTEVIALLFP